MALEQGVAHQFRDRLPRQFRAVQGRPEDRLARFWWSDITAHGHGLVDDVGPARFQVRAGQNALCRSIAHLDRRHDEVGLHPVLRNTCARSVGERRRGRAFDDVRGRFEKALQKAGTHSSLFPVRPLIFFHNPHKASKRRRAGTLRLASSSRPDGRIPALQEVFSDSGGTLALADRQEFERPEGVTFGKRETPSRLCPAFPDCQCGREGTPSLPVHGKTAGNGDPGRDLIYR